MSVKLPQSLTLIDDYAFYCCSSMKALTFPDIVQKIGSYAFSHCKSAFENNILVLPKKLQTISEGGFMRCDLRNIIWNEDLNYIGTWAFCGNDFEEITIPGSVTSSGFRSFEYCKLLKKVELKKGVTTVAGKSKRFTKKPRN